MKEVELSYGATILIPNREFNLLEKMIKSNKKKFPRSSFTPRADVLATRLVDYQVLNRDDENYYLRPIHVKHSTQNS